MKWFWRKHLQDDKRIKRKMSGIVHRWPCFYVPSLKKHRKHQHRHHRKFPVCQKEACVIHKRHYDSPNLRLLCCHHANSRRYRHRNAQSIWDRFQANHKHTGIYNLYLQQWVRMCAQSDELHEADRNDAKDRKESSSFEDEDEDETDEEIVMDLKTALSVLELTEPVTTDGVQKAYRKQALRFHPDKLLNTDTGETMKQINEARIVVLKHISEGTKETKR